MRIKKMQHSARLKNNLIQQQAIIVNKKRNYRMLCMIQALAKVIQIAYYDVVKDSDYRNPKIKAKSDQLYKHTDDILKSLENDVVLKADTADFMEYEHFAELYELLTYMTFVDTDTIRLFQKILKGAIVPSTEEELEKLIRKE